MNDTGYIGPVALEGTLLVSALCRNGSDVPTEPDAAPTYTVYGPDGAQVGSQTGSMTLTPGSKTGLRGVVLTASAANSYASGSIYTVHMAYTISSTNYAQIATFLVN